MNIELTQVAGKGILFDGSEDNFYKLHSIILVNGDVITFTPMDVIELESFEKIDDRNLSSLILEKLATIKRFAPTPDFVYYKNQEGIIPSVKETDKYLAVISLGEQQPARYQIYVEAVFKKHEF